MGRYTIFGTQILSQATGEPGSLHLSKICHSFLSGKKVLSCQEGLRSQARSPPSGGDAPPRALCSQLFLAILGAILSSIAG